MTERRPLQTSDIEDIYELTPLQQGIFFHALEAPESGLYFEQVCLPMMEHLNTRALERAWRKITERHSILRSGFFWEEAEKLLQVVSRSVDLPWSEEDWTQVPPAEQQERFSAFLAEDRARGFDLAAAPLMRITLIRFGPTAWQLVWSFHHLLLDGWSALTVLKEVTRLYLGYCMGQEATLEPVPPFRKYVSWLAQQEPGRAESYWRELLAGFETPTPLGVDRGPGKDLAPGYGQAETRLPASTTRALEQLARAHQLTLNTVLQGAWAICLSRYGGSDDVVYGVIVSGRPAELENVESMVGLFINNLPVRTKVDPDRPLLDWLADLQFQLSEMRRYEHTPLVEVQGWSQVPRGMPLFETIFAFENYPGKAGDGAGTDEGARFIERTNYPLTVMAVPGHELILRTLYFTHRFESSAIEAMLGHLRQLLENVAAHPEAPLAEISLLSESERSRLLDEWSARPSAYPRNATIQELFEGQVAETPDATALVFEGETLTYGQLNESANRLAHRLARLGVGRETIVGVWMERSPELVVALLGVLKAGGAYLPLDPIYPVPRLEFMLEDAGATLLLTQARLAEQVAETGIRVLCVDDDGERLVDESGADPEPLVEAQNLAYVMYTSGSTGTPKGTCIPHRAVVRLVRDTNYLDFRRQDVYLQFAPISFDASTLEIWGPLLNGASLVIAPPELPSLADLATKIVDAEITVLWLTVGLFRQLVEIEPDCLERVRQVMTGGDVVPPTAAREVVTRYPETRLLNCYGPTENTTFTTYYAVETAPEEGRSLPIGHPISNSEIYVLGPDLQPVPARVPGELYIGGDGLARGYWRRPGITAEKFIPDPFGERPGARLYRTGDLVRFLETGELEFLGRLDHQVKIRGFRVEPGELESALGEHPDVRDVAVVTRETSAGDKQLVAYLTAIADTSLEPSAVRSYVKERLPEYLVPAAVVQLDQLPLTPNGKIDRAALARLGGAPQRPAREFVAPRTATEKVVAEMWSELLGLERVGVHDDFFEIGGHSLIATQLISRIRGRFEVELPLRTAFDRPTIAGLAAAIEESILAEIENLEEAEAEAMSEERSGTVGA